MDSKKRPLYLVWDNIDRDGPEIHIIYKHGDGNYTFHKMFGSSQTEYDPVVQNNDMVN